MALKKYLDSFRETGSETRETGVEIRYTGIETKIPVIAAESKHKRFRVVRPLKVYVHYLNVGQGFSIH